MNYNLTLKGHFENLTKGQGHCLIGNGHAAYQSILIVDLNTYKVYFIALHSMLLSQFIAEKLLVPFMT